MLAVASAQKSPLTQKNLFLVQLQKKQVNQFAGLKPAANQ